MKIGFALITTPPFFNEIVKIENKLHEITDFHNKLETINNIPHTTLFQGTFSDTTDYIRIANVITEYFLYNCLDKCLHFNDVKYIPFGWYFYTCSITKELQKLHELTLSECKPYIILEPDRLDRDLSNLTKDQIYGIKEYGYRYSSKAFFPHITLGRTSSIMQPETIKLFTEELKNLPKDIRIGRLTVYEMGTDGMHAKTLYEKSLI